MKYKTLKETPFALSDNKSFTKQTKVVSRKEFLKVDKSIPLLVTNQYQIYPEDFKDLELLRGRKIALVYISYLSGTENDIKEYFLDNMTMDKILNSYKTN